VLAQCDLKLASYSNPLENQDLQGKCWQTLNYSGTCSILCNT